MASLNISLPESMKRWLEARARADGYDDVGEVMRELIRREQERSDRIVAMQQLVDEARASGISEETMADIRERALRTATG